MAPKQKPHQSKQDFATPWAFVHKVEGLLGIDKFAIDLAASSSNTKAEVFISEEEDSLSQNWRGLYPKGSWAWLNPPYTNIGDWAEKCSRMCERDHGIAFLVPASVGSNWFRDYVDNWAFTLALNGRLSFMENGDPYPKDLMLCLYGHPPGFEVWNWREEIGK